MSEAAIRPRCRHAGRCGGCQWQHVPYADQLDRKRSAVEGLLRRHLTGPLPPVAPVLPMPVGDDGMPWGFRHKSAFVFASAPGGGLVMGHFAEGGREIVPVASDRPTRHPRRRR